MQVRQRERKSFEQIVVSVVEERESDRERLVWIDLLCVSYDADLATSVSPLMPLQSQQELLHPRRTCSSKSRLLKRRT